MLAKRSQAPFALLLAFSSLILCPRLAGQGHQHSEAPEPEQLGSVSFPVSCSEGMQASFQRGVALLHSFGYNAAEKQFREIAEKEPACAMAYWGQAMSLYRQLWDRPSKADLQKGHELVQKAQATGAKTERERGYIGAAAVFYQNGDIPYEARSLAYSQALDKLRCQYPDDGEAAIFYALSLLASPHANDNDLADRKKAVAILQPLFEAEPNHPGIAHYLIHACDNPQMARQGLPAAERYARIAPASAHALHMPSHIFARLGLWQEDIQSNLASKVTAEKQSSTADRLHAMDFLLYAYLQLGQGDKAKATENEAMQVQKQSFSKDMESYFYYVQVHFPALLALETRNWKGAESLTPPADAEPDFQAVVYWAQAVGAGHLHHVPEARRAVERYEEALETVKKGPYAYVAEGMTTSHDEARGWLALAEGNGAEATRLLEPVADRQDQIGKGEVEIPAREMLADMLLELHRPQEALKQYISSLKVDPNRFNGLYGAAYAAEMAQQPELAKGYYQQLLANCGNERESETERPELAHAKAYLHGFSKLNATKTLF